MSGSNQKNFKIVGITFSSIGFVMVIVGAVVGIRTHSFIQGAEKAEGSVVELVRKRSTSTRSRSGTRRSYIYSYPVVKFETANGESVEFESNVGSNPPAFQPGESVTVLYNPEQVNEAMIESFWELWLITMITGLNGSVFFFIGVLMLYSTMRQGNQEPGTTN